MISGLGVFYATAGGVLLWSGIKGEPVAQIVREVAGGKQPSGTNTEQITAPGSPDVASSTPAGPGGSPPSVPAGTPGRIVSDSYQYQGHAYRLGGAPGKNGFDPWDCSSFANWVISHDLGLAYPASGRYDGTSHGPATGSWGMWFLSRSMAVSGGIASAQAGDVIVWTGHMGIAIGGGQMISALNEHLGTLVTPIQGNGNGLLICVGRYS